jgi:UDPglucose 6-dehydrogenase
MFKIAIIGSKGMVGGAMKRYFKKRDDVTLFLYDKNGEGSMKDVNKADYVYVCVPTPYTTKCDTSIVEEVVDQLEGSKAVIIKSTVIPGTTDKLQAKYPQHKILFNPEFLTEVTADQDMNFPDRQIIGYTEESYNIVDIILEQLPLAHAEHKVLASVAEFAKYACNTWFAVKVAKNNELYDVFMKFGGNDVQFEKLIDCISTDKRVGRSHLQVWHKGYRGYGGKCLPKDTKALISFAKKLKVETPVSSAADKYNDRLQKSQARKENSSKRTSKE